VDSAIGERRDLLLGPSPESRRVVDECAGFLLPQKSLLVRHRVLEAKRSGELTLLRGAELRHLRRE
jgi:hypothetical protein